MNNNYKGVPQGKNITRRIITTSIVILMIMFGVIVYFQKDCIVFLKDNAPITSETSGDTQSPESQSEEDNTPAEFPDEALYESPSEVSEEDIADDGLDTVEDGLDTVDDHDEKTVSGSLEKPDYDEAIQNKIDELVVLEKFALEELNAIISEAKSRYEELPVEERTDDARVSITSDLLPLAEQLERDVDAQVDVIIGELTILLREAGQDLAPAYRARQQYNERKEEMFDSLYSQAYEKE